MWNTLDKFADVERRQRQGQERQVLKGFPLPEIHCLTLAKIDDQSLDLLDHNKTKTMENGIIVKDILKETQLLSELLWKKFLPTLRDQTTVFLLSSQLSIKGFEDAE